MDSLPRLVVFDCDGTIVDSHHAIVSGVRRAFERAGELPPPPEAVRDRVGLSLSSFMADLAPHLDLRQAQRIVRLYREEFARAADERDPDPLFPGIESLLRGLTEEDVLLGVATGKSRRGLRRVLEAHDLGRWFVTLQTADDAPSKPHPAMVLQAAEEAGCAPTETVMVGDTVFDMEAARSAGARALGVRWGSHPAERLRLAGADAVAEDVADLAGLLGVRLAS